MTLFSGQRTCKEYQIPCPLQPGKCILEDWRCDGERDCRDGEDELNCTESTGTKRHHHLTPIYLRYFIDRLLPLQSGVTMTSSNVPNRLDVFLRLGFVMASQSVPTEVTSQTLAVRPQAIRQTTLTLCFFNHPVILRRFNLQCREKRMQRRGQVHLSGD